MRFSFVISLVFMTFLPKSFAEANKSYGQSFISLENENLKFHPQGSSPSDEDMVRFTGKFEEMISFFANYGLDLQSFEGIINAHQIESLMVIYDHVQKNHKAFPPETYQIQMINEPNSFLSAGTKNGKNHTLILLAPYDSEISSWFQMLNRIGELAN